MGIYLLVLLIFTELFLPKNHFLRRRVKVDTDVLTQRNSNEINFNRSNYLKADKQRVHEMIDTLTNYRVGSILTVDRFYGGIQLIETMALKGVNIVASCSANRPSWIFREFLHPILFKKFGLLENLPSGQLISCKGYLPFLKSDSTRVYIRFYAHSIVSMSMSGKPIINNFLSTIHGVTVDYLSHFIPAENYMTKEGDDVERNIPIFTPGNVFSDYHDMNGFIDQCNNNVIECFPILRETRWKVRILFLFIFTLFHNARMLHNLSSPIKFSSKVWREKICDELIQKVEYKQHKRIKKWNKNARQYCQLCNEVITNSICEGCQMPVCQTCYQIEQHMNYISTESYKIKLRLQRKAKEAPAKVFRFI